MAGRSEPEQRPEEPQNTRRPGAAIAALAAGVCLLCAFASAAQPPDTNAPDIFATADQCIACHSNLFDSDGNDVSIGHAWRASMMAHSAKDPYWQASVRREVTDHPEAQADIEDTCSTCHMPMARTMARERGARGKVFEHLQRTAENPLETAQAWEGVSCTICHQIEPDNFGEHASFDGGFLIDTSRASERQMYGPFEVDTGLQRIMKSATDFTPGESLHVQRSELCATCHTLFTTPLGESGQALGRFPEQVPYLEWQNSRYRDTQSCQDCHMPVAAGGAPVSSVLGESREGFSEHTFLGGNAFMLRILDKYRDELNVTTPSGELEAAALGTEKHLSTKSARLEIKSAEAANSELLIDVEVSNLAGHKLPTAYPSRRAWLHVLVTDQNGSAVFESGAPRSDGSIAGNDNDTDASAFEPHYDEIVSRDQVQIYEPIIYDQKDEVTTGLLHGVHYVKDNRLLPDGFDKAAASDDIAVQGRARKDDDFQAGKDGIRYRVPVDGGVETVTVSVRLIYQPIGYRWAQNLKTYDAFETRRFVEYFDANADLSGVVLAEAKVDVARQPVR